MDTLTLKTANHQNTKITTEALKGAVILLIILGHYSQYFVSDYYDRWIRGYSFGLAGIFFVLAGYGAFISLGKRSRREEQTSIIPAYYLSRAIRIYPYYWASLLVTPLFLPQYWLLYRPDLSNLGIYLGLPLTTAPGIFWFVPAIMQCYLIAPLLHYVLEKIKITRFLILNLALIPVLLLVTVLRLSSVAATETDPLFNIFFYKNFFLTNLLLFSLGMTLGPLYSQLNLKKYSNLLLPPAFAIFVLMLYLTRASYSFYDQQMNLYLIILIPAFILSSVTFCHILMASDIKVPLGKTLSHVGRDSYQLYLFHMVFIALLARFGLIRDNDLWSLAILIICLPLFILFIRGVRNNFGSTDISFAKKWKMDS